MHGVPNTEVHASTMLDGQPSPSRIGIVLSAGYFGFFAHAGFMLGIEELGIDYSAIAGSSAGAIVAALHASGVPAGEIVEMLTSVRRRDIWDSTGITGIAKALLRRGRGWTGWLKGDRFEELMQRHLRAKTFEQCSRALYITALNLTRGADETFHSGTIADKVRASCGLSVPDVTEITERLPVLGWRVPGEDPARSDAKSGTARPWNHSTISPPVPSRLDSRNGDGGRGPSGASSHRRATGDPGTPAEGACRFREPDDLGRTTRTADRTEHAFWESHRRSIEGSRNPLRQAWLLTPVQSSRSADR